MVKWAVTYANVLKYFLLDFIIVDMHEAGALLFPFIISNFMVSWVPIENVIFHLQKCAVVDFLFHEVE